jgi:hypothetical protein
MKLFYSIFLIASLSSFLNAQNVTLTIDTTYLASTYKFTIENNTDSIVEIFPFGSLYNYLEIPSKWTKCFWIFCLFRRNTPMEKDKFKSQ